MKKILTAFLVVFLGSPLISSAVTPLELKLIQTRKFNKNSDEIMAGIKSFCEDSGAQNVMPSAMARLSPAEMSRPDANPAGTKVTGLTCLFTPKIKIGFFGSVKDENKFSQIKAELVKAEDGKAIVRIRLYSGFPPEQVAKADVYSEVFKSIGDALFVQAIGLEAAEQE
jgi:hypothetical protein